MPFSAFTLTFYFCLLHYFTFCSDCFGILVIVFISTYRLKVYHFVIGDLFIYPYLFSYIHSCLISSLERGSQDKIFTVQGDFTLPSHSVFSSEKIQRRDFPDHSLYPIISPFVICRKYGGSIPAVPPPPFRAKGLFII